MPSHVPALAEGLWAPVAAVRPFSGVCAHMHPKVVKLGEVSAAPVTDEGSIVQFLVELQLCKVLQLPSTFITLILPFMILIFRWCPPRFGESCAKAILSLQSPQHGWSVTGCSQLVSGLWVLTRTGMGRGSSDWRCYCDDGVLGLNLNPRCWNSGQSHIPRLIRTRAVELRKESFLTCIFLMRRLPVLCLRLTGWNSI